MTRFHYAHAGGPSGEAAIEACIERLGPTLPQHGLGMLYVTDAIGDHLPAALDRLKRTTGIDEWVGSVGIGICATGREYFDEPAAAVMIADLDQTSYRVFDTIRDDLGEFSRDNGTWIARAPARFGIVHADPRNQRTGDIIADLADELNGFLVGGLSSSRAVPAQIAGGVTEGGVSGVLLSETVAVATALSQSCMPIGSGHEITDCQANIIIELDGRPALDVFKEEIGEPLANDLRQVGGLIFAALPVAGSDTGDYLVRNIVGFDVDRGLIGIGELVERGALVQFCRRDADAAEQDLGRMVESVKRRAGAEPRGALYFTCLARGPNMFGEASEELRLIERALGDVPLVGFFCNGEISHNRLYGYTGVLTLFP